jgi:hypothetical protein
MLAGVALVVLALLAGPSDAASVNIGSTGPTSSSACEAPEGLVTQSIAPGVLQVIADDAGHRFDRGQIREVEVGSDGTVVVAQGRRVIVLGEPGAIAPRTNGPRSFVRFLHLAPWGELWAVEDGGSAVVAEEGRWVDRSGGMRSAGHSIGALEDGSVWRVARSPGGTNEIVQLEGADWIPAASDDIAESLGAGSGRFDFERTTDGRLWLAIDRGDRPGGFATYDQNGWNGDVLDPGDTPRVLALTVGPDGSLWAIADRKLHDSRPGEYVLLKHHEGIWLAIGPEQGMPSDEANAWTDWDPTVPTVLTVDRAGRVWFSIYGIGLYAFDGAEFSRVELPHARRGVLDLRVAPDGSVWVVSSRGALYVICGEHGGDPWARSDLDVTERLGAVPAGARP